MTTAKESLRDFDDAINPQSSSFIRMVISQKERLRRKRDAEKIRRIRINSNPGTLAEENRKRRERYTRRKKANSKKKKSKREILLQRQKWRTAKQRYLAKKKANETEKEQISERGKSIRNKAKKRANANRVAQQRVIKVLVDTNVKLERRAWKYKQRYQRLKDELSKNSVSPKTVIHREFKNKLISPEIRRKLVFGQSVLHDMGNSLSNIRNYNKKREISNCIGLKFVKKYRFSSIAKPYFPYRSFRCNSMKKRCIGTKKKQMYVEQQVRKFFEDEDVSIMSPAKNDQIVKKKIKKQKRFLTNSLKYLFTKFNEKSSFTIPYSSFCKLRPFWIVDRKVSSRDTCLCVKCENTKLMCEQLRRLHIVNDKNVDQLIEKEVYCDPITEACRFRECETCCEKVISILEFEDSPDCYYDSWERKTEIGRDDKLHRRTMKDRIYCSTRDLVNKFLFEILPVYLKHVATNYHQKKAIKELKKNLCENEILVHVDFAENYNCKYSNEIQSIHFGGNRSQISLHTGVTYLNPDIKKSFCMISEDLQHDPTAIFCHLEPILRTYTNIKSLHFLSDSPATQYRNRYMFVIMLKKIIPMFKNLETFSWNYSEAGHGKGAPDGVGATLKRTCDKVVSQNKDVCNFAQFSKHVSEGVKKIEIITVNAKGDGENLKMLAPPIKGTMKIHQVRWSRTVPESLFFNHLSCFRCPSECSHYHETKKIYNSIVNNNDVQPSPYSTEVSAKEDDVSANKDISANPDEPIREDDWVIVEYKLREKSGSRKWIGKILRVNENDTYLITFLRSKVTKLHCGFVYHYPNKPDEDNVYFTQINSKISPPENFQRCLKFSIHCDDLK